MIKTRVRQYRRLKLLVSSLHLPSIHHLPFPYLDIIRIPALSLSHIPTALIPLILTLQRQPDLMPNTRLLPRHFPQRHRRVSTRSEGKLDPECSELPLGIIDCGRVKPEDPVFVGLNESDVWVGVLDVLPGDVVGVIDDSAV